MPTRDGHAVWTGTLQDGSGIVEFGSFSGNYSFSSRFEDGEGTNPEELIGAAHAGCFSMALSAGLGRAGFTPERVSTTAKVHLVKGEAGFAITQIDLVTEASIPGIDEATFMEHAEGAKANCPISKALQAVTITLDAKLVS